jgi:hypothetical protein
MGTQASSGFWIGNILQFGCGEESPRYLLVANNLSLVFFAFLFHSFPQKKKSLLKGNKIKMSVAETKKTRMIFNNKLFCETMEIYHYENTVWFFSCSKD